MGHEIPDDYKSLLMPENYRHCWSWFGELSRTRSSNGFGQNPISYSEIDAWSRLTNIELTPLEVNAIIRLDSAYLNIRIVWLHRLAVLLLLWVRSLSYV